MRVCAHRMDDMYLTWLHTFYSTEGRYFKVGGGISLTEEGEDEGLSAGWRLQAEKGCSLHYFVCLCGIPRTKCDSCVRPLPNSDWEFR